MKDNKTKDIGLLLLRLVFGGFMIYGHGWGKLMRVLGDDPITLSDPFGIGPEMSLWLCVFAETLCSFLLMLGLFSRWVTIPLIVTMGVAAFYVHGDDSFGKMEKALLYLAAYISLFFMGGGRYALDNILRRDKW